MRTARLLVGLATAAISCGLFVGTVRADGTNRKTPAEASSPTIDEAHIDEATPPAFDSQAELGRWTLTVLDAIFVDEARDDEWAAAREAEIRRLSADERLKGVDSISVECRTSICRVVVGLDPTQARRTLLALTVTPPLNTSGFHGIDPDDARRIRLFVSREGTDLMEHPALVKALESRRD